MTHWHRSSDPSPSPTPQRRAGAQCAGLSFLFRGFAGSGLETPALREGDSGCADHEVVEETNVYELQHQAGTCASLLIEETEEKDCQR